MQDLLLQVRGITPGRAAALVPLALGLISFIIALMAVRRFRSRANSARIMAIVALILALIDIVLSWSHLARVTGDIGTGGGKLGAIVAMVFGGIDMVLGALVLARVRRMAFAAKKSVSDKNSH